MTRFLTALGNEVRKGLLFAWSERLQIAMEVPFFALFITLLGPVLNSGHQITAGHLSWTLNSGRTSLLVITLVPVFFFYLQGVKLFWRLLGEIQAGTIEQVYLSPLPSWLVVAAGRLAAAIIETLVVMGVVYGIVSAFVTLHFHWTAAALVPMAFLIIAGIGYSLIMAGMTLLWKRIGILQDGFLLLVMMFVFAGVPVLTLPGWFTGLSRVFPATSQVASLYGVMLGHRGVSGLWGIGGLAWVVVTSVAYLVVGIIVFRLLERITKVRGTLGTY